MSFLKDLTGSNPFATPVGQLIERATSELQPSEDWALLMEICDILNASEEGPKDAMKALKKRLSTNMGKNNTVIMYSLLVLETCVKNCGHRFHIQVAHKEFLQELVKVIAPKNNPPSAIQEKVLSMIQTWADAFQGKPDLREVSKIYQELKSKGVEFPMTSLDSLAPIHTPARTTVNTYSQSPQRNTSARAPVQTHTTGQYPVAAGQYPVAGQYPPQQPPPNIPAGPVNLTQEQMAKLKSELDIVQQNCKVFSEMLSEMNPSTEDPSDFELLQQLHHTCRQMQHRIVELLDKVQNEDATFELLKINDDLNNVFLRYERYERNRSNTQLSSTTTPQPPADAFSSPVYDQLPPSPTTAQRPFQAAPAPAGANLIDFDDTSSSQAGQPADLNARLAGLSVGASSVSGTLSQLQSVPAGAAQPGNDDFDMFAQSRGAYSDDTRQLNQSDVYSNQKGEQMSAGLGQAVNAKAAGKSASLLDKEEELEEMERWLKENPGMEKPGQASATSSEFDRFLADRASQQDSATRGNKGGRQMQKDDDNTFFAL